jgi:hypothetical protein
MTQLAEIQSSLLTGKASRRYQPRGRQGRRVHRASVFDRIKFPATLTFVRRWRDKRRGKPSWGGLISEETISGVDSFVQYLGMDLSLY